MERKRSVYVKIAWLIVIVLILVLNRYVFNDVLSRAYSTIKKPFGFIQNFTIGLKSYFRPYFDADDLRNENEKLKEQHELLLSKVALSEELTRENEEFRKQLSLGKKNKRNLLQAEIISFERNELASTITIGVGSDDGVKEQNAVIVGGDRMVGIIHSVQSHSSVVYLLDDPRNRISVRPLNTDYLAEMQGRLNNTFILNLLSRNHIVEKGQIVVTSGMDGLPENLIVGTIESIQERSEGLFNLISGHTMTFFGKSSFVFVIL